MRVEYESCNGCVGNDIHVVANRLIEDFSKQREEFEGFQPWG